MAFSKQIREHKSRLNVSQKELCQLLYGVPHRTLQSWLKGDKIPPNYVCTLVIKRLESIQDNSNLASSDRVSG